MVGLVAKVGCMASRTECGTPVRPVIDWLPALMKCGVVALSARRSMASRLPHFPRRGPHSARGARAWLGDPEIDGAVVVVVVAAAERGGQGDPLSLAVTVLCQRMLPGSGGCLPSVPSSFYFLRPSRCRALWRARRKRGNARASFQSLERGVLPRLSRAHCWGCRRVRDPEPFRPEGLRSILAARESRKTKRTVC